MQTKFNATLTVAEFKAEHNTGSISVKSSTTGKPYAIAENGMEFKMSNAAAIALSDPGTATDVRISECSDDDKDFFMIHVKGQDSGTVIFTI